MSRQYLSHCQHVGIRGKQGSNLTRVQLVQGRRHPASAELGHGVDAGEVGRYGGYPCELYQPGAYQYAHDQYDDGKRAGARGEVVPGEYDGSSCGDERIQGRGSVPAEQCKQFYDGEQYCY